MKRISYLFLALAFLACNKEQTNVESRDSVSIAPETLSFSYEGGTQQVMATSSGDWTLSPAEEYTWVSPDVESGSDGDIVYFTVDANASGAQLYAEYVFTVGAAQTTLAIISESSEVSTLSLVSDEEMEIYYNSARIIVVINTNLHYRTLTSSFSEGTDWISYNASLESGDNEVSMYFDVDALEGMESRETVITIGSSSGSVDPVSLTLKQRAMSVITTEKTDYYLSLEDTSLDIPVTSNVEYTISITEGSDWLTHAGNTDGVEKFSFSTSEESRSATIVLTETYPFEGEEAVIATISVLQRGDALVNYAINMTDARIYPEAWNNADALNNLSNITIEALVYPYNFDKGGDGTLSTIMGIEGHFLVRIGDAGLPNNQIQIATSSTNYTSTSAVLNTNEWQHIAVTYDKDYGYLRIYLNGERVYNSMTSSVGTINFGVARGNESGTTVTRVFWIGYAYDPNRDFKGLMTELRIWNRALSQDEIQAENHYYYVDPDSEGLVAYWKCNEGSGNSVKDYSSSGNDLVGQHTLYQTGSGTNTYTTGTDGINWVEVSLP